MAAKLEEITATFLGERMRFPNEDGDTIIGRAWMNGDANIQITIKGQADTDELQPEQTYRFYGRWTNYTNKRTQQTEKQFAFQSFVRQQPHSLTGIVTYLKHAGEGLGFSTVRAKRCYDLYGSDAVKMLREQPEQVAAALTAAKLPLSVENARKIAARLEEDAALEGCTLDLMDLLTGRGFPKSTARLAVREWDNRAAQVIRRDPYSLMRFRSCGFKRCDALYLELKLPPGRLKRQALAAWYELASDTEGHTWYPLAKAVQGIKSTVRGADLQPERALRLARLAGATAELRTDSPTGPITPDGSGRIIWIAEGRKARNEGDLAERIATATFEWRPEFEPVQYRTIERYDGYRFGTDGTVQSCWSKGGYKTDEWHTLKSDTIKGGYLRVRLRTDSMTYEAVQVAHLILEAFVGPRPIDAVACHGDGNPANNSYWNLRWDTRESNEADKKRHGTHQTGSGNPAAKITEADAVRIRELYDGGGLSTYDLSDQFGISRPVVCKIVKRELWRHV